MAISSIASPPTLQHCFVRAESLISTRKRHLISCKPANILLRGATDSAKALPAAGRATRNFHLRSHAMAVPASAPTGGAAKPVLISFLPSHFCEKARWALDRCGIPYVEEPHGPPFQEPSVKKAGGKKTVPCLRLPAGAPEGSCVDGSTAILRWADNHRSPPSLPSLFPAPHEAEISALCDQFDARLGSPVRKWNFAHNLELPEFRHSLVEEPVPAFERNVTLWGWPVLKLVAAAQQGIKKDTGKTSFQEVKAVFDDVSARLADGRRYLVGDTLTAADITFASMSAIPLGQPYGSYKGVPPGGSEQMNQDVACLRHTRAGEYALRLWREDRAAVLNA